MSNDRSLSHAISPVPPTSQHPSCLPPHSAHPIPVPRVPVPPAACPYLYPSHLPPKSLPPLLAPPHICTPQCLHLHTRPAPLGTHPFSHFAPFHLVAAQLPLLPCPSFAYLPLTGLPSAGAPFQLWARRTQRTISGLHLGTQQLFWGSSFSSNPRARARAAATGVFAMEPKPRGFAHHAEWGKELLS